MLPIRVSFVLLGALLHGLSLLLHLLYTTPRVPRNLAVMNF